jgi:hypothetical protein
MEWIYAARVYEAIGQFNGEIRDEQFNRPSMRGRWEVRREWRDSMAVRKAGEICERVEIEL